ncbi:MAG: type IV secretory system conjugative DNA transfer family protein, partial [Nitrososphaerota archaeon]|nr:type IV secretory system conjugative DNA transfer family protein [Nitrososphaerota archaeon]
LGIDAEIDPAVGKKMKRGVRGADRIHTLVMGFPGCGKTRFLLSQIKQHIDHKEGFMVIDSHSDLTQLVLSHIPREQWNRVVYINPWSAFETKYDNRVVQINFLEAKDPFERDVVARMFMDTLEKIYERWWGPRLDMILLNALYLLMEKENAKLPDLYKILADTDFREMLTAKCRDNNVRVFWEKQYDKMPKDASMSVLTKLYRIVQERILVPMSMAEKSCVNFREAMDQQKIVIVDLPEGVITTDMSNFLGSLILSATYNAGMSREDIPEKERVPFYVYVDEAYRYTTKSISETLQSLRKFKVFITLASQYLTQYRRDIQDAITQTCETIISFRVGEDTARVLEKFYPKKFGYQTLMNLPRHLFFVSTPCHGNREYQVLQTIDHQTGPSKPEEVIKHSLKEYGNQVDVDELMGQVKPKSLQRDFLDWPVSPAEWVILLSVRLFGGSIDEETLQNHLQYDPIKPKPYVLTEMGFANALKNLAIDNTRREAWLVFKEETVRQLREEAYAFGKKELKAQDIHTRLWRLDLSDKHAKRLLDVSFRGEKAGGVEHICTIMAQRKIYWQNGWIVHIDTGETDESLADLYVTPTLPASRVEGAKGFIDQANWDYPRSFAVEVECYPQKHWERLEGNYRRNQKMGFPTVFIVPSQTDEEKLREKLYEWNAVFVANSARFEPDHPEQVTIEIINMFNNQPNQTPERIPSHEPKQTQQSSPQKSMPLLEQNIPDETETELFAVGDQQVEALMLELAGQGRYFRLKVMKGKTYLCARQGQKERTISLYTEEVRRLIEKNKIHVKGHLEN